MAEDQAHRGDKKIRPSPSMTKKARPVSNSEPPAMPAAEPVLLPNRMEVIRFKTREDSRKAMGVFHEYAYRDIYFTFSADLPENTCVTNTLTVRALKQMGVDFEWLTENRVEANA
jgi:hypothetical protein